MNEEMSITKEWLDGLISARNDAKSIGATQFSYDGYDFLVSDANYLIDYCKMMLEAESND